MKEVQTTQRNILLLSSDKKSGESFYQHFIKNGYLCGRYTDEVPIRKILTENHYDICVLNIQPNAYLGIDTISEIRLISPDIPIIMTSSVYSAEDIAEAYRAGIDDYMILPLDYKELIFRIKAILHRSKTLTDDKTAAIRLGKFIFIPNKRQLLFNEQSTILTNKESELLSMFCSFANSILPRSHALIKLWKRDTYFNARSMDVYVSKLRKHLSKDPDISIINIHGKGFRMVVPNIQTIAQEN